MTLRLSTAVIDRTQFNQKGLLKMLKTLIMTAILGLPLAACATIQDPTPQELAYCENMERQMGVEHRHDHAEAKGVGVNPMNVSHNRCRAMLGLS